MVTEDTLQTFIKGVPISDALPYEDFARKIESDFLRDTDSTIFCEDVSEKLRELEGSDRDGYMKDIYLYLCDMAEGRNKLSVRYAEQTRMILDYIEAVCCGRNYIVRSRYNMVGHERYRFLEADIPFSFCMQGSDGIYNAVFQVSPAHIAATGHVQNDISFTDEGLHMLTVYVLKSDGISIPIRYYFSKNMLEYMFIEKSEAYTDFDFSVPYRKVDFTCKGPSGDTRKRTFRMFKEGCSAHVINPYEALDMLEFLYDKQNEREYILRTGKNEGTSRVKGTAKCAATEINGFTSYRVLPLTPGFVYKDNRENSEPVGAHSSPVSHYRRGTDVIVNKYGTVYSRRGTMVNTGNGQNIIYKEGE